MKNELRKKPINFEELRRQSKKHIDLKNSYHEVELQYEIALQLLQARVNAGLTQEEMATRMGTTPSIIAYLESGRILPTQKTLSQYAKAIGKDIYVHL